VDLLQKVKTSHWLATLAKKRILTAWVLAVWLVLASQQPPHWLGISICFLGASLRFWASGYLRKSKRPAVGGPYSMTRNPLYLGTYIMAIGAAIAVQSWLFLLFATIFFYIMHDAVIRREEKFLTELFGAPYLRYCQLVPRLLPRLAPAVRGQLNEVNPSTTHFHFSWKLAMQNRAYDAYAAFIALVGFLALAAYVWQFITIQMA